MAQFLFSKSSNITESEREKLEAKLDRVFLRLAMRGQNGGNPFLYVFASCKKHYLYSSFDPHFLKQGYVPKAFQTAATNGKVFIWNKEYLEQLDINEIQETMEHECYHITACHTHPDIQADKIKEVWALTIDFHVDGMVEQYHIQTGRSKKWPLYAGKTNARPLSMEELFAYWAGTVDGYPGRGFVGDIKSLEYSLSDLYKIVREQWEKSPRRCKKCNKMSLNPKTGVSTIPKPWKTPCCPDCGVPIIYTSHGEMYGDLPYEIKSPDEHIDSEFNAERVLEEVKRAGDVVKQTHGWGELPGYVQNQLLELENPQISRANLLRSVFRSKVASKGMKTDYARFNRRPEFLWERRGDGRMVQGKRVLVPLTRGRTVRYTIMVDTSASMGQNDISLGVTEVKTVADETGSEGYLIYNDTVPRFESMVKINSVSDLHSLRPEGGGGTEYIDFFRDFERKIGGQIDVLFVITDGGFQKIPISLKPKNTSVIWLQTHDSELEVDFGRVIYLHRQNRVK